MQFIKHIRINDTTGQMFLILLEQYQLYSSMIRPVLEDTRPVLWSTTPWID